MNFSGSGLEQNFHQTGDSTLNKPLLIILTAFALFISSSYCVYSRRKQHNNNNHQQDVNIYPELYYATEFEEEVFLPDGVTVSNV